MYQNGGIIVKIYDREVCTSARGVFITIRVITPLRRLPKRTKISTMIQLSLRVGKKYLKLLDLNIMDAVIAILSKYTIFALTLRFGITLPAWLCSLT
jgi:hypothetical protein